MAGKTSCIGFQEAWGHFLVGGSSAAFPSDPALTDLCLLLTFLPSFCHLLPGGINKSGRAFLFLTNRQGADCQWGGRCFLANGGGGRDSESSSWAVWIGAQHHTGPAAGVPDGLPGACSSPLPASVYVPLPSLSPWSARRVPWHTWNGSRKLPDGGGSFRHMPLKRGADERTLLWEVLQAKGKWTV